MSSMTQMPAIIQNAKIVQFPFKDKCKFLKKRKEKVFGQHRYKITRLYSDFRHYSM